MHTGANSDHNALDDQILADAYWHLIQRLRLALPPPPEDSAEALLRRDHAAIAQIAALVPGNAVEANLAAQFVAASEQWMEWLRLVQLPDTTPERATTWRARAERMMRQANSVLQLLLRLQATRRQLEADNAVRDRLHQDRTRATRLMLDALAAPAYAEVPATPSAQPATPAAASAPEPEPSEAPPGSSPGEAPAEAGTEPAPLTGAAATRRRAETDPELIAAAERYAATHPERAAFIRSTGKMPPGDVRYFDPPEAALAPALIAGRTAALLALDRALTEPPAG